MRTYSAIQLLQVLVENNKTNYYRFSAKRINLLERKLLSKNIICDFTKDAFMLLEYEFGENIYLTDNELIVKNPIEMKEILNREVRFIQDKEVDKIVLESWKAKK